MPLSEEQLKALQSAIPFQRPTEERGTEPPILLESEPDTSPGDDDKPKANDPEPYRKKFRRKYGGDVVSGTATGYDTDILLQPPDDPHAVDGVSPL